MRVTLRKVADEMGLAVSTVSRALRGSTDISEETRTRVLQTAMQLGYRVRPSKDPSQTGTNIVVCVSYERNLPVVQGLHQLILHGVRQYADEAGLGIVLGHTQARSLSETLARAPAVKGCILCMPLDPAPLISVIREAGLPVAVANRDPSMVAPERVDISVHADEDEAARLIVAHFVEMGHERIAFVADAPENRMIQARAESFRRALRSFGFADRDEWIVVERKPWDRLVGLVKARGGPTAVAAASDLGAMKLLQSLDEHDVRVPDDVSLAGIHNVGICEYTVPPLTSVEVPFQAIGYETAKQVNTWSEHTSEACIEVTFRPRLVRRASVGPPPNR